jgi:glyoxylate/hydroxypyruvate reductase A
MPATSTIRSGRSGAVVQESALLAALSDGTPGAATLDVFATEPLPADHPPWRLETVPITPHLAGITRPESARPTPAP